MGNLLGGSRVLAMDYTPSVTVFDTTQISNITSTAYTAGSPEVGVTFMAPTTGRVLITTGGGFRNNGSNADRVFLSPQVFLGTDNTGTEVLHPTAPQYGVSSGGGYTLDDFQFLSRTTLLDQLTPGSTYYVRTMHCQVNHLATPAGTVDLVDRTLVVAPAS